MAVITTMYLHLSIVYELLQMLRRLVRNIVLPSPFLDPRRHGEGRSFDFSIISHQSFFCETSHFSFELEAENIKEEREFAS